MLMLYFFSFCYSFIATKIVAVVVLSDLPGYAALLAAPYGALAVAGFVMARRRPKTWSVTAIIGATLYPMFMTATVFLFFRFRAGIDDGEVFRSLFLFSGILSAFGLCLTAGRRFRIAGLWEWFLTRVSGTGSLGNLLIALGYGDRFTGNYHYRFPSLRNLDAMILERHCMPLRVIAYPVPLDTVISEEEQFPIDIAVNGQSVPTLRLVEAFVKDGTILVKVQCLFEEGAGEIEVLTLPELRRRIGRIPGGWRRVFLAR